MGHFRSNLRDLEFNLFEVFRVQDRLDTGAVRRGRHRHRPRGAQGAQRRGHGAARRVVRRRRPQPARLRPGHPHGHAAAVAQGRLQGALGRRVVAAGPARPSSAATASRRRVQWAAAELILGSNPAAFMYLAGPSFAAVRPPQRHRRAEALGRADDRPRLGRHDGAHRARRGIRRGRRPHQGGAAGRRQLARRGREALHHLGRARPHREHHAPRAGPPRGSGNHATSRHQGPLALPRAEVPLRLRDRRARRAQWRLRHERRAQDGPQGLHHLRAHVRPARRPGRAGCSATCTTASRRCSR